MLWLPLGLSSSIISSSTSRGVLMKVKGFLKFDRSVLATIIAFLDWLFNPTVTVLEGVNTVPAKGYFLIPRFSRILMCFGTPPANSDYKGEFALSFASYFNVVSEWSRISKL